MSTFLYFIPKLISQGILNLKELAEAGVTWIDPKDRFQSNFTTSGPGGQGGAVVSMAIDNHTPGAPAVYDPKAQTWRKDPSGKFWVGILNDQKPTPATLKRAKQVTGSAVKLLDGNDWIVPRCVAGTVRGMAGPSLPSRLDLDDAGKIVGKPLPEYEAMAAGCFEFFQLYLNEIEYPKAEQDRQAVFERQIDLAIQLLGINYRIGSRVEVIALLGLFSSDQWRLPLRAAIEADVLDVAMEDAEKKAMEEDAGAVSPSDGSATSAGATGASTQSPSISDTSSSSGGRSTPGN